VLCGIASSGAGASATLMVVLLAYSRHAKMFDAIAFSQTRFIELQRQTGEL